MGETVLDFAFGILIGLSVGFVAGVMYVLWDLDRDRGSGGDGTDPSPYGSSSPPDYVPEDWVNDRERDQG